MTVTDLLQHLSEGRKVKTERGEFTKQAVFVRYKKAVYADLSDNGHLATLLDEIGEGVWVEEPEPIVKWSPLVGQWYESLTGEGYMCRAINVKREHIEAFEKHVESFKGEA